MSQMNVSWRFDKQREAGPDGDRPVLFAFEVDAGPGKATVQFILPAAAADKLAGDLLNTLSGGIEVAREMPRGGAPG